MARLSVLPVLAGSGAASLNPKRARLLTLDPKPKTLGINCPESCSLHPSKIGWKNATALAATRARGAGETIFGRRIEELLGHPVPPSNIHRHFKHYVEQGPDAPDSEPPEPLVKPTDIDILDSIIVSGYRNSKNWKPTIRDTLEAMKLKTQMTGNSAFDDLIKLFDVDDDDEEVVPESTAALLAEGERQEDEDEA
jgi:hypothetical protein